MTRFVSLLPHPIIVLVPPEVAPEGGAPLGDDTPWPGLVPWRLDPQGGPALRVVYPSADVPAGIGGFLLRELGEPSVALPEPVDGVVYVVSMPIATTMAARARADIVTPDTDRAFRAPRDREVEIAGMTFAPGQIAAVPGFIRYR